MSTVYLITGFLGAGKTTFIEKYARYLQNSGQEFAVIENEFGAAGVDTAILKNAGLFVEELAGGCICCSLKVNFHDTLIELAKSYSHIIIEPSGIFSPDDFFEIMNSPDVKPVCEIGCVLMVLDPLSLSHLSAEDEIVIAGEVLSCKHIIVSKTEALSPDIQERISSQLEDILSRHAPEAVSSVRQKLYGTTLPALSSEDFVALEKSGYSQISNNLPSVDHTTLFQSCTLYPDGEFERTELEHILLHLQFCGIVSRVKGYVSGKNGSWFVNYASGGQSILPSQRSAKPMLNIIGRNLNRRLLKKLFIPLSGYPNPNH